MKVLMAQPSLFRFQWELDTAITSIRGLTNLPIVLLFTTDDQSVIEHFKNRYSNLEIHAYPDTRDDRNYPPATQHHLIAKYFQEDPTRGEEYYFQIDSDVIFRKWPNFDEMALGPSTFYGADCSGYIDYQYLSTRRNGDQIISTFARILGVDVDLIKATPGLGAQFFYYGGNADMWHEIAQKDTELWHYLEHVDSDVQRWTGSMWSQLYIMAKYDYTPLISTELNHCTPTDNIEMWEHRNILHNAGVIGESAQGLLYKGKYVTQSPFDEDLSWVRRDKAGWHYKEAVEKAASMLL